MHTVLGFPDFLVIGVLVALFGGSSLALASAARRILQRETHASWTRSSST
jgi:hypothetical protein